MKGGLKAHVRTIRYFAMQPGKEEKITLLQRKKEGDVRIGS